MGRLRLERTTSSSGRLFLQLLGSWNLTDAGRVIQLGGREQRLAALLALRGTRPRPLIAGTLWPDTTEHNALTSLRAAIMRTQRRAPGLLAAGRTTIGLDPAVQVDVHDLVRDSVDDVVPAVGAGPWLPSLLSGEELLPGWYDDWMIFERERLQQVRLRRLEALARRAIEDGDAPLALEATRLAVRIEPLLESVRALRILAHLCAGDRTGAVREFHEYRFQVAHELDVSPSPALMELVRPLVARPAGTRNTDASSDDGNSTVQATVPAARAKGVAQGHSRLPPSR